MDEKSDTTWQQSGSVHLTKSIRCIVKLGGAAITCKNELETINEENLKTVSSQLRQSMIAGSSSGKVLGMDWSRKAGESEVLSTVDGFDDQPVPESCPFIVVHGAGSFGHFQASKSGVHKGGWNRPLVKAGFVATRISVTNLNLEIVRALAREGIPSIGMSPFACGWSTHERNIASADLSVVAKAIDSGLVPVLHGDAVLDDLLDCTILSGDVIISHLAAHLKPDYVVFLTDVPGVYDRPPSEPDAVLLREIAVAEDGSWSVVRPTLQDMNYQVKTSVAVHDTTGGMMTKIAEAAVIAKLGINVYIVKAATSHALRALSGELKGEITDDWLGTLIRFSSK
ncbi:isopentenyl phosphate kinase [Argentina anserina]|uniref:isopentenyl phosphate kinase n=1 Tax=Argentina anserina TaxID=57926 RepID=UPI0021761EAC|nr:isopentenyl phosphate kinase [Potentilla anserina]XP_050373224.1 isopentenyl phosphate kinase [Potentilla anserina]